jgi:hypothetical protein
MGDGAGLTPHAFWARKTKNWSRKNSKLSGAYLKNIACKNVRPFAVTTLVIGDGGAYF